MKIGVIGIGRWGTKVVREYIDLMNEGIIDSVVLCDKDESRLKQFDGIRCCNDLSELLKIVDGIHICTPNYTHYEISKIALKRDVHVLVEKPMTIEHNQAYELIEISTSKDLILQVGHIYRFANAIRKVKELYEKGYFGEIYYFNLTWTHLIPYMEGVDVLWDLLPHPLDILNFITKKWPKKFIGVGRAFRRKELNEIATLQAVYDNFFANIHLSWLSPIRRRLLEVVGSERTALIECVKQEIKVYGDGEVEEVKVDVNNTIREEAINFIDAIRTGKNNYNSSIVGARCVEMIERAIKSLE